MAEQYADRLTSPASDPYWQTMDKQFTLNSCDLLYWIEAAGSKPPPGLVDFVSQSLERLSHPDTSYLTDGVHGTIYPLLARYSLANKSNRGEIASEILSAVRSSLLEDRKAGIGFDLPYVDRAEFETIKRRLSDRTR